MCNQNKSMVTLNIVLIQTCILLLPQLPTKETDVVFWISYPNDSHHNSQHGHIRPCASGHLESKGNWIT